MEDGSVVIDVKLNSEQADKQLAKLSSKIDKLAAELNKKSERKGILSEQLKTDYARLDELRDKVRALKAEISTATTAEQKSDLKEHLSNAVEEERRVSLVTGKMQTEYDKITQQIAEGTENLSKMKEQAGQLVQQIERNRPFENLSSAIDNAKQKLGTFIKYAIGIRTAYALFRRLRSSIVDSVKAFANYDAETRNTIQGLRASLDALKLSWGAAFAPILNAVAPLLQKLIGWLASAANAISQFIAVLSGRATYKKAIANTNKLANSVGSVGAAAKEARKQLMAFDDLNVLQDDSSTDVGGGGAGSVLGADMTEEQLSPWAEKLKNHLSLIKDIALGIGAALATWTIANFLNHVLGLQLAMSKLLGLALAVGGAVTYFRGFINAFNNGVNWNNVAAMIGGCATAALGLGLAFGKTASAAGLLAGGIGMILVGAADWIKTGTLSTETFWLLEAGIAAVGVALAMVVSPWSLLVAAFAAGALAVYKYWNVIEEWWNEKVKPWFTVEKWRELGRTAMQSIKDGLNSISMPRFHFSWGRAAYNYNFFGKTGTVSIPYPNIDWYARGGVFDKATMIGVGENGKEAVVPLEKNTEWITLVADGLLERFKQKSFLEGIAEAFVSTPLPAMAGGSIVPPNSYSDGSSGNPIMEEIRALREDLLSALTNQPIELSSKLYIDRREVGKAVTEYQRSADRANG